MAANRTQHDAADALRRAIIETQDKNRDETPGVSMSTSDAWSIDARRSSPR
jgi:hypothetical protein